MASKAIENIDRERPMRGTVVGNNDATLEGLIQVIIPKLMLKADPALTKVIEEDREIDSSMIANSGMQKIVSSKVTSTNYVWARPIFSNEFTVPYVGQTVYCFFEDGDPNKIYYQSSSPSLRGEVTPMEKVKKQANVFNPDKKPFIHVLKELSDGTILYYDENEQRLAFTFRNNHSISINNNEIENCIELVTNSGHTVVLDDKNKNILLKTSGGHLFKMDDPGKKILAASTGGHSVTLDDGGKNISLKTTGGHSVTLDDGGKKISSVTTGGQSVIQDDSSKTVTASVAGGGSVVVNPTGVVFSSTGLGVISVTPAGVFVN